MKHLLQLTKTLLVMALLCVGASNAWADHEKGVYETNLETATGTVGETDKSSLFWNAHSMEYVIVGNGTYTIEFTNYGGTAQWNSFDLVINNGTASYNNLGGTEYAVLRADNYGWGTCYDASKFTNTFTQPEGSTNDYWVDYAAALTEANVVMTITRVGTTVSMSATITPTDETYSAWTYSWSNTMAAATGNIGFEFTTDASYMTITSASYTPADIVGLPTTYTNAFTATSMAPFAQTSGTVNTVKSTYCGYLLRAVAAKNGTAVATAYFDSDTSTSAYDAYVLSDGEKITISFISYNGYYNYGGTTKFAINNSDGTELVSYTYNSYSSNIENVSIGGATADDFKEAFTAISYYNTSGNVNGFTDSSKPYRPNSGYNTTVTITISYDGAVSINFNQSARSLDKTFSKTLSGITMDLDNITMTNAISGRDNNSDRVMGIGNLTISSAYTYNVYAVDGESNRLGTIATVSANYGEESSVAWSKYVNIDDQWYVTSETTFTQTGITAAGSKNVTYATSDISYFFEMEGLTRSGGAYLTEESSSYSGKYRLRISKGSMHYTPALSAGVYTLNITVNNSNAGSDDVYVYTRSAGGDLSDVLYTHTATNGTTTLNTVITVPEGYSIAFKGSEASDQNNKARMDYMTLTKITSVSKTISSVGWATFCSQYALDFSGEIDNLDAAYIITGGNDGKLEKTKVEGTVAANTGLLLKGSEGTVTIPVAASGTDYSSTNKLIGVTEETTLDLDSNDDDEADSYIYVLMYYANALNFYKTSSTSFTLGANTAYLPSDFDNNSEARMTFILEEGTTAIKSVSTSESAAQGYYNLAGQRVSQPVKGLYIKDGKKYVVK